MEGQGFDPPKNSKGKENKGRFSKRMFLKEAPPWWGDSPANGGIAPIKCRPNEPC